MRSRFIKAFTLVEMLVALAVSAIIIGATYASYEMVATQYKKNIDIADMHTSGRAIMRIIERDVRMAGFEYRDKDAKITYGSISNPLTIKDSGNKCCDEVSVIYDYFDEEVQTVERIRIRYWAESYTSNKGARHRLYKQKDILGRDKKILATPVLGNKEVMADYIEDLQIVNADSNQSSGYIKIDKNGMELTDSARKWSCVKDKKTGLIWEVKTTDGGIHDKTKQYRWGGITVKKLGQSCIYYNYWAHKKQICGPANSHPQYYSDWNPLVNGSNNEKLCGYTNWKTPNQEELLSLVDNSARTIDRKNFPNTNMYVGLYWTSQPFPNKPTAQAVAMHNGNSFDYKKRSVWALRLVSKNLSLVTTTLVSINLTLRTKNQYGKDRQFKKKDYHDGNFKIDKTDKYKRDTFSTTVLVRNLAL